MSNKKILNFIPNFSFGGVETTNINLTEKNNLHLIVIPSNRTPMETVLLAKSELMKDTTIVETVDKNGYLYVSGGHEGFAIFSPEGKQLENIQPDAGDSESPMAGFVSNVAIGGSNNNQLMVSVGNQLLIYEIK